MKHLGRLKLQRTTIILFLTILIVPWSVKSQQQPSPKSTTEKFASIMQLFTSSYVNVVNTDKLTEEAIKSMLAKLDPHSVYISKGDLAQANESLDGSFEGIGIDFQINNDTIVILEPSPGGPSDKVGILVGDKIIKINSENATGKNVNQKFVFKNLRGPRGTTVSVTIIRAGINTPMEFTITRDKIPLNSIDVAYMIEPGIGYVKLNKFARTSFEEFQEALQKLKKGGLKDLILDLRNNGGGYVNIALNLADQFLSEGKRMVYTEGLHSPREEYKATSRGEFEKGKLIVLINEYSASASEILSGAMQDWDRGLLIGRRSFGKGLVQRPFVLPDSSVVRLTIAHYYTPSGRCIQKSYINGVEDYQKDIPMRLKNGELMHADSIHFPDSLKYKTNGDRIVYGGGGIMPDIFVPIDTTANTPYLLTLVRKGVLNQYPLEYIEKNRQELLAKYPTLDKFKSGFDTKHKLLGDLVKNAEKRGIKEVKEDLEKSAGMIENILHAVITRVLYGSDAYYEVINSLDHDIQKAIDVLKDDTLFKKNGINY